MIHTHGKDCEHEHGHKNGCHGDHSCHGEHGGHGHGEGHNHGCCHGEQGMRGRKMFGNLLGIIMNLLDKQPMKGLEIIQTMESVTMGMWKPSPGSVYPLLATMESEGLISKNDDGRYELTDTGKKTLEERQSLLEGIRSHSRQITPEKMISEIDSYLDYFKELGPEAEVYSDNLKKLSEKLKEIVSKS